MKKGNKNRISSAIRTISFLLVMLFISTIAIEALHGHQEGNTATTSEKEQYSTLAEKCKVCDYYAQNLVKHAILSYPGVLIVPIPAAVALGSRVLGGIYKFTLQGFTNKGPPNLLA